MMVSLSAPVMRMIRSHTWWVGRVEEAAYSNDARKFFASDMNIISQINRPSGRRAPGHGKRESCGKARQMQSESGMRPDTIRD